MCWSRRQFIWFANSKLLEEGSDQSRQLLQTFRQYGRIVGPNQLMPLGPGQFQKMTKTLQENYHKKRDRRMRTNKQNDWRTQAINFREEKQQMNNYCYNKLLWRPTRFRNFHLLRDRHYSVSNRSSSNGHTTNLLCSTSSNVNYDGISNSGIMASSTGLVRAISNNRHRLLSCTTITAAAHSQQKHFCTSATNTLNTIPNILSSDPDNTNNKLPDPIEQKCREWAQILRAECRNGKKQTCWMKKELKCRKVLPGLLKKTTRLYLSTKDLTPEQLLTLRNSFPIGQHVEIKLLSHQSAEQKSTDSIIDPPPLDDTKNLRGIIDKFYKYFMLIYVNQRFNPKQREWLKQQCTFLIKKTANPGLLGNELPFLTKRHSNWCKWPDFKRQPRPEDIGVDSPVDWAGINGKDLDSSQCAALSAALNMKRPIVAVHGPPGSGKTRILTEYLHILSQQAKKVLVVSSTDTGLYHLVDAYCKQFPSAASSNGNFLCMKCFDAQLASKVIADERIVRLIEANSSADKLIEQLHEIERDGKGKSGDLSTTTQGTSICFVNTSYSTLNLFIRLGLNNFDVVIIDDAVKLSQFKSSWKALSTAPVLRLFGDYNQPGIPVNSPICRKSNFNKSLMQRLDEQFGPDVNFHLRRQYRSNAAIQDWPNRAFYGQRAAEPDESVRDIRLDDLLEAGKSAPPPELITDPLVLVDLGQLEEHDPMFKAEAGGQSWFNLGEAFLTASHLWHLFEHIPQLHPSKIAHLTHHGAQRHMLWSVFSALFKHHLEKLTQIRMERSANLQGQQFDVVIQDCVTVPPSSDVFIDPYHLKRLNFEMCLARRQFIWFTNSQWLEEGSEQSRQLLQTFREYGRIVGPDQLLPPAESSEFWKMPPMEMEVEEENCREKKLMNKRKRRGGIREFLSFFRS